MAAPEFVVYEMDDPRGRFDTTVDPVLDGEPYTDQDAPQTYTLTFDGEDYPMHYVYSKHQGVTRQASHVYRMESRQGTYTAYVDSQTGEWIYFEFPERAASDQVEVSLPERQALVRGLLVERVRDPEAYHMRAKMDIFGIYTCEFTRTFQDNSLPSSDRVCAVFDSAGNVMSIEIGFMGALRYASQIPEELVEAVEQHIAQIEENTLLGKGEITRVVLTPDGRLALDCLVQYRYGITQDRYAMGYMRFLAYLTEPAQQ